MSTFRRIQHGRNHTYRADGRAVEGVTSIISAGLPKPGLTGWAAREVAEFAADHLEMLADLQRDEIIDLLRGAPWRDRDRAANRGTEVHGLAQRLAAGEDVDVPEELVGHVDSYLTWWDAYRPEGLLIERPCLNRTWRYAGTFDMIANLNIVGRTLVDIKTNRSGPYGDTGLQLAAYGHAETYLDDAGDEQPMPQIDAYGVLWLRADGFDYYPYDVGDREWKTFQYVSAVARWIADRSDYRAPNPVKQEAAPPIADIIAAGEASA